MLKACQRMLTVILTCMVHFIIILGALDFMVWIYVIFKKKSETNAKISLKFLAKLCHQTVS